MTKALILVKSPRLETYKEVINQLLGSNRGITEITWAYLNMPIDRSLIPSSSPRFSREEHVSINHMDELRSLLKKVSVVDVTGLPKDATLQVFSTVVGHKGVHLCTLSRSIITPYVELTSEPLVASFRRSYLFQKNILMALIIILTCGLVSFSLAKMGGFDSNSPFITWLGVFLGVVGLITGLIGIKRT